MTTGHNPVFMTVTLADPGGPIGGVDLSVGTLGVPIQTNARMILDDDFIAGALNLSPYLTSIRNTGPVLLVIDIDNAGGAKLTFDALTASALYYKKIILQVVPNATNPVVLTITLANPSRVQVWAYGDV